MKTLIIVISVIIAIVLGILIGKSIYDKPINDDFEIIPHDYSFWLNAELVKSDNFHNYVIGKSGFYIDGIDYKEYFTLESNKEEVKEK